MEGGVLSPVSMATSCSGRPPPNPSSVQSIFRISFPPSRSPFSALLPGAVSTFRSH